MNDFPCTILRCGVLHGAYHRIVFHAPHVAAEAKPGQFVHVRVPALEQSALRRPCDRFWPEAVVLVISDIAVATARE